MPYTPPSQQSPTASRPESPSVSRSNSYQKERAGPESTSSSVGPRPGLPRSHSSTAYLHKHRRSPSITKAQPQSTSSFPAENSSARHGGSAANTTERGELDANGSLRQSPPPVNKMLIPTGAIATPPESSHNSSDEEESSASNGSGRHLENLEELQAAIRIIEQHRASSPTRQSEEERRAKQALELVLPSVGSSLQPSSNVPLRPALSKEARKISHSRSTTEASILLDLAQPDSPIRASGSDDSDTETADMILGKKPPMLRKKSGELVRPALRPASARRRPSSMPGTPTYSKAVHFDSHLEHVRHFLQVDKPLAVSAGSSPVESYESEVEFPFSQDEPHRSKGTVYEWEIRLSNFPADTPERRLSPVCIERLFLSSDNRSLVGVVAVANLAFTKHVAARFTLDNWKTTSEVVAEYNHDMRRSQQVNDGRDRFNFTIRLADLANLENKTMFVCIRYSVEGREFWDNNSSMNYQIDFSRKVKAQTGKNGMSSLAARPLNALPRSRPSPPTSSRPKSMPVSFDDFSTGTFDSFEAYQQTPAKLMGESPIRLKKKSSDEILPDAPTRRMNASGQAFSNRYNFGASLSAAIQASNSSSFGDRSGLQPKKEDRSMSKQGGSASRTFAPNSTTTAGPAVPGSTQAVTASGTNTRGHPPGTTGPGMGDSKGRTPLFGNQPLSTASYQELVDKYCFFGSSKTSPQLAKPTPSQMDGANDDISPASDMNIGNVKSPEVGDPSQEAPPPPTPEKKPTSRSGSPHLGRSTSPTQATSSGLNSRSTSPISFGYPYHQAMQNGFFSETSAPTATYG